MLKCAGYIEQKIYYMLLFTVAVIPLHQEFTAFCVAMTFFCALFVKLVKGKEQQRVLGSFRQKTMYGLLAAALLSLPLSLDTFISSWNLVYVAGQYIAIIYVLINYGVEPLSKAAAADMVSEAGESLWQRFQKLPRPLQLLCALAVTALLESILGIGQKLFGVVGDEIWSDPDQFPDLKVRVYGTLVNPNILAGYLVLVISYCAAFFHYMKENKKVRIGTSVLGLLACLSLLYTYSRGNWLACAFMLMIFCLFFCHRAMLPVLGLGAAGLLIGGQAVLQRLSSITSGEDTSAALRIAYLESTWAMIEEHPWGVGWYGYRFQYPDYNFYLDDKNVIMYHCHNIFLNIWSELGPLGIICFLVTWGSFVALGWRLVQQAEQSWARALGCGYVLASSGIALGGLTDHIYFNTKMGLIFWLLALLTVLSDKVITDGNICNNRLE